VRALEEQAQLALTFPRVIGYRYELPYENFTAKFDEKSHFTLSTRDVPTWTESAPVIGESVIHTLDDLHNRRVQEVDFLLAKSLLENRFRNNGGQLKPWLFPQLITIVRTWRENYLHCQTDTYPQLLLLRELADKAVDRIHNAIYSSSMDKKTLRPILPPYNATGSTHTVDFFTVRPTYASQKSHISHVVEDSGWESKLAQTLERMGEVKSYAKNHNLGFAIPYTSTGHQHNFIPDFLVHVDDGRGSDNLLNLIIEVSGQMLELKDRKVQIVEDLWIPAVNNDGRFGRWAFMEITDPYNAEAVIRSKLNLQTSITL
jgi:type III restriction enzyme